MKTNLIKTFLTVTTICISFSSFAQTYDNDTTIRHRRLRDRLGQMDICSELKDDLADKNDNYQVSRTILRASLGKVSSVSSEIRSRRSTLNSKKSRLDTDRSILNQLEDKQANKGSITRDAQNRKNRANTQLPNALQSLRLARANKETKCTGLGLSRRCRNAKQQLRSANALAERLQSQINAAQAVLNDIATIDTQVINAAKTVSSSNRAYLNEQSRSPSISVLESELIALNRQNKKNRELLLIAEEGFIRTDIKANACKNMKFAARKAPVFNDFLITYATEGCSGMLQDVRRAKGPAAKAGIRQAYKLVCESDNILCGGNSTDTDDNGRLLNLRD